MFQVAAVVAEARRLPPGPYETKDFPVLSAGPTPRTPLATWDFTIRDPDGPSARWSAVGLLRLRPVLQGLVATDPQWGRPA